MHQPETTTGGGTVVERLRLSNSNIPNFMPQANFVKSRPGYYKRVSTGSVPGVSAIQGFSFQVPLQSKSEGKQHVHRGSKRSDVMPSRQDCLQRNLTLKVTTGVSLLHHMLKMFLKSGPSIFGLIKTNIQSDHVQWRKQGDQASLHASQASLHFSELRISDFGLDST